MGRGKTPGTGRRAERGRGKKLKRDVRERLARRDVPFFEICPGRRCCGRLAQGPDPCRGCPAARASARPGWLAEYAAFLADYVETFRPEPQRLSWRDYEIYCVFRLARDEFLAERERKFWKERKNEKCL